MNSAVRLEDEAVALARRITVRPHVIRPVDKPAVSIAARAGADDDAGVGAGAVRALGDYQLVLITLAVITGIRYRIGIAGVAAARCAVVASGKGK